MPIMRGGRRRRHYGASPRFSPREYAARGPPGGGPAEPRHGAGPSRHGKYDDPMTAAPDSSSRSVLISGGTVAADYGLFDADILIADGRIAALGHGGSRFDGADEVIDARGLV